ncbi:MAG: hypothetical protein RSE41_06495 [Clostridia bacterium]
MEATPMVYKKVAIVSISIAVIAAFICNFTFATDVTINDKVYDSILNILISIQKYSWPLITLMLIFALYKFYVLGAEVLEQKMAGQTMIMGITIFMAIIQCLPLFYAFITIT